MAPLRTQVAGRTGSMQPSTLHHMSYRCRSHSVVRVPRSHTPPHGEEAPSHRAEIADLVALRGRGVVHTSFAPCQTRPRRLLGCPVHTAHATVTGRRKSSDGTPTSPGPENGLRVMAARVQRRGGGSLSFSSRPSGCSIGLGCGHQAATASSRRVTSAWYGQPERSMARMTSQRRRERQMTAAL